MRDDDPEEALHDEFCAALFGSHPLGRPVLGTEESVTAMSRQALHRFYRARYTPQRMVLTVAGNVSHSTVLAAVRRSFGHRLAGCADPVSPRGQPVRTEPNSRTACPRRTVLGRASTKAERLTRSVACPNEPPPQRPPTE